MRRIRSEKEIVRQAVGQLACSTIRHRRIREEERGIRKATRATPLLKSTVCGPRFCPCPHSATPDEFVDSYAIYVYTFIGGYKTCIAIPKESALRLYLYRREGGRPLC